jgi:hypothetical protein
VLAYSDAPLGRNEPAAESPPPVKPRANFLGDNL